MMRPLRAPMVLAANTNSRSAQTRVDARTTRAMGAIDSSTKTTIRMNTRRTASESRNRINERARIRVG